MRITVASIVSRVALVVAPIVGARLAVRDVTGDGPSSTTWAACTSRLPGSGARCDSDRFVGSVEPFVVPALLGGVLALAATIAVLLLLRAAGSLLHRSPHGADARVVGPAWVLQPPAAPGRDGLRPG